MLKLTRQEKYSLFFEGLLTILLLFLLDMALITVIKLIIQSNPGVQSGIFIIKRSLNFGFLHIQIWSYQRIATILLIVVDVVVLWWRLFRRYHLYQLDHIISELHYIAHNHFEHRIPFRVKGKQQLVIASINILVNSVIHSMDEERKSEKSKDELISNVSHDLRTPLTSIIGYLGLIENHQYHSEEDLVKYAHIAYDKAKQMRSLVEELFEFTKVQQRLSLVNVVSFDLNQLLEQVAASFEIEASRKNITITTTTTPDPLPMIADPDKLGRVFSNLVSNALRYSCNASYVSLTARQLGNKVVIEVANDGQQIPADAIAHLFERFYRVESSRSKATGGTGLGLAIVKSIVDLHHGKVTVTSTPVKTSFIVTLPLQQQIEEKVSQ